MTNTAKDIREFLKENNIKAKVRKVSKKHQPLEIVVSTHEYPVEFTPEEQTKIRRFAKEKGATWVRKLPINIEQQTNPYDFYFYFY